MDGELDGILAVYSGESGAFDVHSVATLEDLTSTLGNGIARLRSRRELRRAFVNSIDLVAAVVESRDPYTAGTRRWWPSWPGPSASRWASTSTASTA